MNLDLAKKALKKYFGYEEFRPMQDKIIQAIYQKKDCVVLMPTGGGKSMCFQIPAVTSEGLCVVVSPLISLMKDQVDGLLTNGIPAAYMNSTLTGADQLTVENEILNGKTKLLYVSPERLLSSGFFSFLKQANISLIAIDEAHCISQWGHDFRPEYTKLKLLKQHFNHVPIVALTATADKITRKDIINQLELKNPETFLASFDRPNLSLKVSPGKNRLQQIKDFIDLRSGESGIIYCLSRKNTEDLVQKLQVSGIQAAAYHAGMSSEERSKTQEEFVNDSISIICATVAFGMGIDKSNVRWIIHYSLPKNMEAFYQQIGRAGRDGLPSDTLLFYSFGDIIILRKFIEESNQKELLEAKLKRMQQYAESYICRRKILLSYFNEHLAEDCGNCDVCKNPPEQFDGTVIVQKALSAISRLNQRVGMTMVIDVLRGSGRKDIIQRNYHKIKTYGAGANLSNSEWQQFILQMINMGFIEVAYDDFNILKLTPESKEVLYNGKKVDLVRLSAIKKKDEAKKSVRTKKKRKHEIVRDELFEVLRQLRRNLAREKGVPPYLVFTDATLSEMSRLRPTNEADMSEISGVGQKKLEQFGEIFINEILKFIKDKSTSGAKISGTTTKVTLYYFNQGKSIEEIGKERGLNEDTIHSHLASLIEEGEKIDVSKFITPVEYQQVKHAVSATGNRDRLKDLYEDLNEEISYSKIRYALAMMNKA